MFGGILGRHILAVVLEPACVQSVRALPRIILARLATTIVVTSAPIPCADIVVIRVTSWPDVRGGASPCLPPALKGE